MWRWLFLAAFCVLIAVGLSVTVGTCLAAAPLVAPTEALTPDDERAQFKLPPGFEIQLVASEPDIQKPMNLNFDARGRLWVTHSIEYPWPVADANTARDAVTILDGIGPDGRATKISRFADKLNIPIGVLPLHGGSEAIVWSIPNLWKLRDTDGDGQADRRDVLFGPYDFADTHGNQNALRLGLDGWVYACHGFRNHSKVKRQGEGEVLLEMQSGNTYRFRPDGSAIEQLTWGQVNPFGQCFDPLGNRYSSDCHSRPVYMLLRGSHYPSFGKPHDGLGYGPDMINHEHGSTGIAGVIHYTADHFPAEYRGQLYIGNPVTGRVHRDKLQVAGSTQLVDTQPDFIACDDLWFRPVDIQLGPDGAIYIADFYNCIIGHYEVDLKHPRRDRHRGRIWRVVWKGTDGQAVPPRPMPDLTKLPARELAGLLGHPNLTLRTLATHALAERPATEAAEPVKAAFSSAASETSSPEQRAHATRALERLGALDETLLAQAVADASPLVRAHAAQVLAERKEWQPQQSTLATKLLLDHDAFVRRFAADAIGQHPHAEHVAPLLTLWNTTPADDTHLIHTVRIALRNQLRAPGVLSKPAEMAVDAVNLPKLAEVSLAVPTEQSALFLFELVRQHSVPDNATAAKYFGHITRYAARVRQDEIIALVREKFAADAGQQLSFFQAVQTGLAQRGVKPAADSGVGRWAAELAGHLLAPAKPTPATWVNHQVDPARLSADPWGVRHRPSTDGHADAIYFDSLSKAEQLTGELRSVPFALPQELSFWMCGHNGFPTTNPPPVNHVRLRLAGSGEVIAKELPPRSDTARKYTWDLRKWTGQSAVFEIVDADGGNAYAWLAVGRFDPPVLHIPAGAATSNERLAQAVKIAGEFGVMQVAPRIVPLVADAAQPVELRVAAAQAAFQLAPEDVTPTLARVVQNSTEPQSLRKLAGDLLGQADDTAARAALTAALAAAPDSLQQSLALSLGASRDGAEGLLKSVSEGKASARLLQDKQVVERLRGAGLVGIDQRLAELTKDLPSFDENVKKLIAGRLANYSKSKPSAEAGQAIYLKHCAACHRIAGQGAVVGPQLDGVGIRGVERLMEDLLDPSRNVDGAFRTTLLVTTGGKTLAGLLLRTEGETLILADNQGKPVTVPLGEVDQRRLSPLSPMPANVADLLKEEEFFHLLAYLLTQREPPRK